MKALGENEHRHFVGNGSDLGMGIQALGTVFKVWMHPGFIKSHHDTSQVSREARLPWWDRSLEGERDFLGTGDEFGD